MTEKKQKKIRLKIGQLFQIPLTERRFAYCQMSSIGSHAFFNYFDDGEDPNIEKILNSDIIFYTTVDSYVFKEGVWKLLGCFDLKREYISQELFSYDSILKTYIIWRMIDGILRKIPATPEEIKDLECFASSNDRHIIERLEDYLAGRPNYWVEADKNQHNPNFPGIVEFYKRYGYDYKRNIN